MTSRPGPALYGAVDIGSNSILLLVAHLEPGGDFEVVHEDCRITRLGRGVDASGALHPEAVSRTLDGLREIAGSLDRLGVTARAAVGTSALRDASNAATFLKHAEALLGCPVEVVQGRREAALILAGLGAALSGLPGRTVVFDVGGGSTELIAARDGELLGLTSLDLGAVRLTERYLHHDPPLAEELAQACRHTAELLAGLERPLESADGLFGIAGTITTLSAVEQRLERYDRRRIDGSRLSREQIQAQVARFAAAPLERRQQIQGLEPGRADIIIGGALIVLAILDHYAAAAVTVSDRGVRWGLLRELAARR